MRALSFLMFAAALAGCDRVAADRADPQLVARVNGIEISARQIRTGGAPSVAQAVEKVIDRELLVQKALEAGPGRDPPGEGPVDNPRPQGLAQAFLQRAAGPAAPPGPAERRALSSRNPAPSPERGDSPPRD